MTGMVEVARAKEIHKELLLGKPNVVGVGTGFRERQGRAFDELCVVAMVDRKIPKAGLSPEALIPHEVDGVPTDVIQVGRLQAMQTRSDRWRPAPGGVSIGHFHVTAGTLACIVRDKATRERLILSNNHVLANSNEAAIGDPVLQPGTFDGGSEETDTIAHVTRFELLSFKEEPATCEVAKAVEALLNLLARLFGSQHRIQAYRSDAQAINIIDAAVARPLDDGLVTEEILDIGVVGGTSPAMLGMSVRKSGRTTGYTTGDIRVLDATVDVDYNGRVARFEGQIVSTPMSSPGDSGSLLVAGNALLAVGLLFAGSQQATIYNPIGAVLDKLDVVL